MAEYTSTEASRIAATIRSQIEVGVFMALGASDLGYSAHTGKDFDLPGLVFVARILPYRADGTRSTKARKMIVHVSLTPADTYTIHVTHNQTGDRYGLQPAVVHAHIENVYADQLSRTLLSLDSDDDRA